MTTFSEVLGQTTNTLRPLVPANYDAITGMTYDAAGNMLTAVFRVKGDSTGEAVTWSIAGTLTMTYDSAGNMLTAVRS